MDVLWLAELAKLKLSDAELEQLTSDMEDIVAFAGEVAKAAAGTVIRCHPVCGTRITFFLAATRGNFWESCRICG